MRKNTAAQLVVALISLLLTNPAAAQNNASDGHWVSAWATSVLVPMQFPGMPPEPPIANQTIRMVVRPTLGGQRLRVRLSNEFETSALLVGAAHMALTEEGSKIKGDTDRVLTFGGKAQIAIPAGAPMLSDPADLPVKAFSEISISLYLPASTPVSTWHFQGQHDSYLAGPGDMTGKTEVPDAAHKAAWYFLSGIEVWAPNSTTVTVAFGDSITQGTSDKPGTSYTDWPYQLAQRLSAEPGAAAIAVVNEGIGGNRILHDAAGVSALARFDRDVLSQPGVTRLILLEGINDIGFPRIRFSELKMVPAPKENPFAGQKVSAEEIIGGLQQIIVRAHEHGIKVFGGTLTPFEGTNSYDAEGEAIRQAVNRWIRTTNVYDGIFDFDTVVRDPAHPTRLLEAYDSGDHIHPSPAGYKAMADCIPIAALRSGALPPGKSSGRAAFAKPVKVEGGLLQGAVEDGLRVYRGIPYAAPPVDDLRWRPPQPAPKWEGVRAADQFGRACVQTNAAIANLPAPSEDCLYVNVWTPARRADEKLPVLVWIHGGGFVAGAPAEKLYHGEWLAKKGVVVVSIAYRLGVFGFLAHPELSAENPRHVSGNYGLLDMIAGLQWVQRNISAFGGDPKRVTIQGESAGAAAASMLCASPLTKGLFHGAISESGGSFGPVRADAVVGEVEPLVSAEKKGADWLASAGVSNIAELRKIPAEKLQGIIPRMFGWARPNMDSWLIADDQYKLYQTGHYNDVPVLVGYNSDEGATFGNPSSQEAYIQSLRERYGQFADKILAAYPGGETPAEKRTTRDLMRDSSFGWNSWVWARLQTKTGKSKVFLYYFDEKAEIPAGLESVGYGARHASELPYVFRQLTEHGRRVPTPKDEALSDMIRNYWTNFVKTGDPNSTGLPKWPAYSDTKPQMLRIEAEHTKAGPLVNENGLKVLDEFFAWRRTAAGKPLTH